MAELRAKREAADYIVAKLTKKPDKKATVKGIGRKRIEWDADLKLACECTPQPIELPEYFPVRGQSMPGFFVRDPKNLDALEIPVADNIASGRDDKLLTIVREFIAINLDSIEKAGAQMAELVDMLAEDQPHLQSKTVWAGTLIGPQSILNQVANVSGRFAVLTADGKVLLKKDFKTKS